MAIKNGERICQIEFAVSRLTQYFPARRFDITASARKATGMVKMMSMHLTSQNQTWHMRAILLCFGLLFTAAAQAADIYVPKFTRHVVDNDLQSFGADIGDRNEHGPADIVALDWNRIFWYANGERHLIDELPMPALLIHLRTTDIDLDGDVDVIAADHRNGRIYYYENPGAGARKRERWVRHLVDDRIRGSHAVALADLDKDGRMDIVASGEVEAQPGNTLFWYAGTTNVNTLERWPRYELGPGQSGGLAHYPGIGDVNLDGKLDVVLAAKNNDPKPPVKRGEWYRLWLQPEDAKQPWKFSEVGTNFTQATNIQIGDVNGDGVPDLVATQGHHTGILWFEGPSWKPHYIDQTLKSPHSLVLADLDRDGDLDIATCAFESKVLCWFANDGKAQFTRHDISTDQAAYDLVARDMDADGDLDLIVAGQNSRNVVWYEQTGTLRTIRVMSYNIHHGEGMDKKLDLQRIAEVIQKERADIVALQEVDKGVTRTSGRNLPAELAALTGMSCVFSNNYHFQGGEYGNAILSRFAIESRQNLHYKMLREGEQRGLLQLVLRIGSQKILFMNTHIDYRPDNTERLMNVEQILEVTKSYPGLPVMICGDFNDTPGKEVHNRLLTVFNDTWQMVGKGDGLTIPVTKPTKRIDYIFLSKEFPLKPVKMWVPETLASDHLPIVAEFELP